ncbi:diguanylate cyclase [Kangiella marina]|uniref:diguanylate cyclase n=1 Tax=Kangiella marina TaxID=1079178 RepID=A0ABP8IH36_9GAMM
MADMLFWGLIGIPFALVVLLTVYDINSTDFTQVILIKQALNGLLNASIATIIRAFIPFRWYSPVTKTKPPKLSKRIFELCLISIAMPSLVIMLILSNNSANKLERELIEELDIRAEHLRERTENYQMTHVKAMETLAASLNSDGLNGHKQFLMDSWLERYPGFITMIVTDSDGVVVSGAPKESFEKLLQAPAKQRRVTDRDYFKVARDTGLPYVSDVFRGRGFGNDPIVAVSVPLYQGNRFQGIVEGSLNLPQFERIDNSGVGSSILVIDSTSKVIYGSARLELKPLDLVSIKDNEQHYANTIMSLVLNGNDTYNYKKIETSNGWSIYVLSDYDDLLVAYKNNFYALLLGILLISLLASRVALKFSLHITRPLERLVEYFSSHQPVPAKAASYFSSREIESVREQLREAQHIMIDFQEELKEQVETQTKELVVLNEELERLSTHDVLTGILNRRGFEQVMGNVYPLACRNKTPATLAIMDLDNFKHINDTYGHSAGDLCLMAVGKTIREVFQRDSDYVGRFGGEEFIALILGGSIEHHLELLEQLRQKINKLTVPHENKDIQFTISIGAYSQVERYEAGYERVISRADKLLYKSKEAGRNRISHQSQ